MAIKASRVLRAPHVGMGFIWPSRLRGCCVWTWDSYGYQSSACVACGNRAMHGIRKCIKALRVMPMVMKASRETYMRVTSHEMRMRVNVLRISHVVMSAPHEMGSLCRHSKSLPRIFFLPRFLGCGTHHFLRSGRVLYLRWRIWDKGRAMGGGRTGHPGVQLCQKGLRLRPATGRE